MRGGTLQCAEVEDWLLCDDGLVVALVGGVAVQLSEVASQCWALLEERGPAAVADITGELEARFGQATPAEIEALLAGLVDAGLVRTHP